jgi:hypothetical protein
MSGLSPSGAVRPPASRITLPGDVERVPGDAAHRPALARERLAAGGTAQQREDVVEGGHSA